MADELGLGLEERLRRARAEPAAVLDFYRALTGATLVVAGERIDEERFQPRAFVSGSRPAFVAFTSAERCLRSPLGGATHFQIPFHALVAGLPPGSELGINPDDDAESYALNDLLLQSIANGSVFEVDEGSFTGSFYTGRMRRPEAALKQLLREVLSRYPEVENAYMTTFFEPKSPNPPLPAVGLLGRGDPHPIIEECRRAIDRMGLRVVLYAMDRDPLTQWAMDNTAPFYWKQHPAGELPAAKSRAELLALVRALPDEPDTINSPMKQYLAGDATEEAAQMWAAMSDAQRAQHHDPAAFTRHYVEAKHFDLALRRGGSTHAQARRSLVECLEAGRPFSLFLHDFGLEAVQYTTPHAVAGFARVHWLTLPSGPVDELRTFFAALTNPTIGVVNPLDVGRIFPAAPLLELGDDWLPLVVSLIAHAEQIFLLVTATTGPGLIRELSAIQRLGREDATMILVPDDASRESARELVDMLQATAPFETPSWEATEALQNRLSTYGLVTTWAEFKLLTEAALRRRSRSS